VGQKGQSRPSNRLQARVGDSRPQQAVAVPELVIAGRGRPELVIAGRGRPELVTAGRGRPELVIAGRGRPELVIAGPSKSDQVTNSSSLCKRTWYLNEKFLGWP
jgi:hypothetical protein